MPAVGFRQMRQVGPRRDLLGQVKDGDENIREGVVLQETRIFQEAEEKLPVPDEEFPQRPEIRAADLHGPAMLLEFPRRFRKFLCRPRCLDEKILPGDPTESIDRRGVGKLMKMCVEDARKVNPVLKIGICGEHGGDPSSIEFCHMIGLNYVSCSPFRVPIARLAAARAAILNAPKAEPKKK